MPANLEPTIPRPPSRVPEALHKRLVKEMQVDVIKANPHHTVENSARAIVCFVDDVAKIAPEWTTLVREPTDEELAGHLPVEIQQRLASQRKAPTKRGRPTKRPDGVVLLVQAAITQWYAATGQLPSATDSDYFDQRIKQVVAPLFKTLRRMLRYVSPRHAKLLTPDLYFDTLRRFRKQTRYAVLGNEPPKARRPGPKPKQRNRP